MKYFYVFLVLLLCISCKTKYQYVEVPKETIKVEYKDKLIHDSIYNIDSVYIKEKNDTIYHFKTKIQYKYKYIKDTIFNTDTIKTTTIKPIEVTKEIVTNKIKWHQKIFMWLGGVFMLFIIYKLTKYIKRE